MAKLPTGVSRVDHRTVDRPAAVGSDEEERFPPGTGPQAGAQNDGP